MTHIKTVFVLILLPLLLINCKNTGADDPEIDPELVGLIWSDEFEGDRLDYDEWTPETGANGWGNSELQNYTAIQNTEVSDGTLKIIAKKVGDGQGVGDYTSARLLSTNIFGPGHRMEIRAKIPDLKGPGLWPAIWMLGDAIRDGGGWPASGEIDIMEYVSKTPNSFFSTVHTGAFNHVEGTQKGSGLLTLTDIEEEFNIFGIIWTEDYIKFYVEDPSNTIFRFNKIENATNDEWPFDNPHFFILNLAVGGNFGGPEVDDSNFPATFEIDYVRVFEL